MVATSTFWPLARVWYEGRLDLDYRPRSPEEAQNLLTDHGLGGPFWKLG